MKRSECNSLLRPQHDRPCYCPAVKLPAPAVGEETPDSRLAEKGSTYPGNTGSICW